MIDYYKAIDTETGQEVPYLREVSNRISPEMSAQDCFVALSFLREEREGGVEVIMRTSLDHDRNGV